MPRLRKSIPKVAAFAYAGYKWLEDHTDDVERWSAKAIQQSRGKNYEKFVKPAAGLAGGVARWVRENHGDDKERQKQLPT